MRVSLSALVVLSALSLPVHALAQAAPAEERAILAVIDQFMHAVTSGDAAAMAAIRLEGTTTTIERPDPAGGTTVMRRPFPAAAAAATSSTGAATSPTAGSVRERYWDPVVHVRGSLAVVWTPYEFWRDGKTSHCGVDVFELAKQAGVWTIGNVMYTVEPDACPAMRPKDKTRIRPAP
jgi:hypothetical protein